VLVDICEELNESEFFNITRLDYFDRNYLVVLEFDDRTIVCNLNQGKVF
jgi:hypothetical protein